jgi:class 3 adenylate cyclase
MVEEFLETWGVPNPDIGPAPSAAADPAVQQWMARLQRLAASPRTARMMALAANDLDARDAVPDITQPTLVLHRRDDTTWDVRHSRYLADHIGDARLVLLPGQDSLPWLGDADAIIAEIEEFLTGRRSRVDDRRLLTVMFTDIVDATARAASSGDGQWRDRLADHDAVVRGQLARFDGREVKTTGDGFLATFAGPPSQALYCAAATVAALGEHGFDVRVGMHTGECELVGDDVAGMAVHIASRVNALAAAGEVLVSGTVFGTVVGGPFAFESRGSQELKGVPGAWPIFALDVG